MKKFWEVKNFMATANRGKHVDIHSTVNVTRLTVCLCVAGDTVGSVN